MASDASPGVEPGRPSALLASVVLTAATALVVSLATYATTEKVIRSLDSQEAMVVLLTDEGVRSDDEKFERDINSATAGLAACRDISLGLALGSLIILGSVVRRMRRPVAPATIRKAARKSRL